MRVWLVTIGEPVPVQEGRRDRLHRTGYFAHFLAEQGHDVVWWTSTFDHFRKRHWFESDHVLRVSEQLEIQLLHGCGYCSNVSLARLRDHRQIARRFAALARQEVSRPDIIVAAFPTIELCRESTKYGQQFGVPVILDIRDLWPDIFLELLPKALRAAGYLPLAPLYLAARKACREATAIIGVTEPFVEWGVRRGGRRRSAWDRSFSMGYVQAQLLPDQLRAAEAFWEQKWGISSRSSEAFIVIFFGTFGRQFVFEPIIEAARILRQTKRNIRFVLCGDGDRWEQVKLLAAGLENVVFPGWVGAAEIRTLMQRSAVGLAPYRESLNFTMNIANKPAEYFSGGLPVALSLKYGVLCDLLHERQCGFSYGDDPQELARRLSQLQDNPVELQRLSTNARAVFEERFVAEKVYGEMLRHLEQIAVVNARDGLRNASP